MPADLSSSFPQLTWRDQSIITVYAGDDDANITRMTIHLAQDTPQKLLPVSLTPPLLNRLPVAGS